MSFSSAPVQRLLTGKFVCTGKNTVGDANAGESFKHAPNNPPGMCLRGNGEHNVQMLFLTPQGEIFHAVSGYVPPDELVAELEFALDLFEKIQPERDRRRARQIVQEAHRERLKELGFSEEHIQAPLNPAIPFTGKFNLSFANGPQDLFDGFIKGRILADYRYTMDHPLVALADFKSEQMVGSAKSFFGSSSSGSSSGNKRGRP